MNNRRFRSWSLIKSRWLFIVKLLKKVKVAHARLPSVGFRSWSRLLAVSLQVTWVINPPVDCHYIPPGLQLLPQPLKGCYQFCCLVNRGTMGVNSLPMTVTRQRRDCDLNPGPSAPESSTLTTRLPSHPYRLSPKHLLVKPVNTHFVFIISAYPLWRHYQITINCIHDITTTNNDVKKMS